MSTFNDTDIEDAFFQLVLDFMGLAPNSTNLISIDRNASYSGLMVDFEVFFNLMELGYSDVGTAYSVLTGNLENAVHTDTFTDAFRQAGRDLDLFGLSDCSVFDVSFSEVYSVAIFTPSTAPSSVPTEAPSMAVLYISRFAGVSGGTGSGEGSDGPALDAELAYPVSVWQAFGVIFVVEQMGHCVRQINSDNIITAFAGVCGSGNYSGDGGSATSAELNLPSSIMTASYGTVYIADYFNNVIRAVNEGIISTYAGLFDPEESGGNDGQATSATFLNPYGLWLDSGDTMYIVEMEGNLVRTIDVNNIVHAFAGAI